MEKQTKLLGEEKISSLLVKLSIPAMIGMLVMAFYNVVDSIFVGRFVGVEGIGAIAIAFPIQMVTMALAQMIGIGGSSVISRSLGAKEPERAERTFGNIITMIIILSVVIVFVGLFFTENILLLFGSTKTLLPYAKTYFLVMLSGTPAMLLAMSSNNVVRAEGRAKISMTAMIIGAFINIILDAIFIIPLKMGIFGAALATIISQYVTAIFLMSFFLFGKSVLRFRLKYLALKADVVFETLSIGLSAFARQAAASIMAIIVNNSLKEYGGDISLAVFGVIFRVLSFLFMPMLGFVQGLAPIAGFNYGAKKYDRVIEAVKRSIMYTTIIGSTGFAIVLPFAPFIIKIFNSSPQFISEGSLAMRMVILSFPIVGMQIITAGLFQALGKAIPSLILSLLRQVIFLIPFVLIFSKLWNLKGVWYAFPAADICASLLTLVFLLHEIFSLKKQASQLAGV